MADASSDYGSVASYSASASASDAAQSAMSPIDMLIMAVPGKPGEDYPILASVPETAFTCEGRTEGGYYADVEADCQPFHVCVNDGHGGSLSKFSFLCPNGTMFSQEYFTCEWWFNVDCAASEGLYSLNEDRLSQSSSVQQSQNTRAPSNYGAPAAQSSYALAPAPASRAPPRPAPSRPAPPRTKEARPGGFWEPKSCATMVPIK